MHRGCGYSQVHEIHPSHAFIAVPDKEAPIPPQILNATPGEENCTYLCLDHSCFVLYNSWASSLGDVHEQAMNGRSILMLALFLQL